MKYHEQMWGKQTKPSASTVKHNDVENQTAHMNFQSYQHQLIVPEFGTL